MEVSKCIAKCLGPIKLQKMKQQNSLKPAGIPEYGGRVLLRHALLNLIKKCIIVLPLSVMRR